MRLAWAAVALSLLPSFTEAAQQPRATGKRGAAPAGAESGPDVFAGYSYTRAGDANLNGWELSGSLPYRRRLRLAVDLSGHYGSFGGADLKQPALGGPRTGGIAVPEGGRGLGQGPPFGRRSGLPVRPLASFHPGRISRGWHAGPVRGGRFRQVIAHE